MLCTATTDISSSRSVFPDYLSIFYDYALKSLMIENELKASEATLLQKFDFGRY